MDDCDVGIVGEEALPGRYSFFLGDDPRQWRTDVPAYRSVRYEGLFEGVAVRVREGAGSVLEYDVLDGQGGANARLDLPNLTALVGHRIHSAFVIAKATVPFGIQSISNTLSFSITR